MPLSSEAIAEIVDDLDKKEGYYLVSNILPSLDLSQVESLLDKLEEVREELSLKKETSVLFDIREINKSYYAYIKRLGKDYPNTYLGLMRFREEKVYKLTNKFTGAEKIIRGLGLEQKELQTYLKIEFLYPERVIRSYLFYDGNLEIPRTPQKADIEAENYSTEAQGKNVVFREDWNAIFDKKTWHTEEIQEDTILRKLNISNKEQDREQKTTRLNSEDYKKLITNLDAKKRYYLASKVIQNLTSSQIENLLDRAEKLRESLISGDTSVLLEIREVNKRYYIYRKRLGKEYKTLYLGVVSFKQDIIYKLTNKETRRQKVIRWLGLEQKGLQTYLKIEFLYPEKVIRNYLFYDGNLALPQSPQQVDIEKVRENLIEGDRRVSIFSMEQNTSDEDRFKNIINPREDWSAIFVKNDWRIERVNDFQNITNPTIKEVQPEKLKQKSKKIKEGHNTNLTPQDARLKANTTQTPKSKVDNRDRNNRNLPDNLEKKQIPPTPLPENLYKKKVVRQPEQVQQEFFFVAVKSHFTAQVETYLYQWAKLSQLLPKNPPLSLVVEPQRLVLSDVNQKILVEYDRKLHRLSAKSPRLVYSLLHEIISNVAINTFIPAEQRALGQKWLAHLQKRLLQDEQMLLTSIFDL